MSIIGLHFKPIILKNTYKSNKIKVVDIFQNQSQKTSIGLNFHK